jgi:hypothetical protein
LIRFIRFIRFIRSAWFVGFIGVCSTSTTVLAQVPSDSRGAYLALLERYAAGDGDGAARAVLALEFDAARKAAEAAAEASAPAERRRLVKLSVLLHTEASLRTPIPSQQLVLARDGIDRLWRDSRGARREVGPFIRAWYLLVVSHLSALGQLAPALEYTRAALERFPGDAELLLARGSSYETDAYASVVDRSLLRQIYTPAFIARWRIRLYDAQDDYREAYARRPELAEARLRWGRIESLVGDAGKAEPALEEVASGRGDAFLRYLGAIFLAELREGRGDLAAARRDYQNALAAWPEAQAPKLALSRLCAAAGDMACAQARLAESFGENSIDRADPFLDYHFGQAWLGAERLKQLRVLGLTP